MSISWHCTDIQTDQIQTSLIRQKSEQYTRSSVYNYMCQYEHRWVVIAPWLRLFSEQAPCCRQTSLSGSYHHCDVTLSYATLTYVVLYRHRCLDLIGWPPFTLRLRIKPMCAALPFQTLLFSRLKGMASLLSLVSYSDNEDEQEDKNKGMLKWTWKYKLSLRKFLMLAMRYWRYLINIHKSIRTVVAYACCNDYYTMDVMYETS